MIDFASLNYPIFLYIYIEIVLNLVLKPNSGGPHSPVMMTPPSMPRPKKQLLHDADVVAPIESQVSTDSGLVSMQDTWKVMIMFNTTPLMHTSV